MIFDLLIVHCRCCALTIVDSAFNARRGRPFRSYERIQKFGKLRLRTRRKKDIYNWHSAVEHFATAFEQATEGIFGTEGLGLYTEWIGSRPNGPDVLTISTEIGEEYLGILDSKAYKEYSISGNNRRVMTDVYLPKYQTYKHEGKELDLAFFSYVAGGFKSTINSGINRIFSEKGVHGSAITAAELLLLLKEHRKSPISANRLKQLFSMNRQILPRDFSS